MNRFIKVRFSPVEPEYAEILIAELSDRNFYAFEQDEQSLTAYCKSEENSNDWKQIIPASVQIEEQIIEDQNWNAKWESNFKPVTVADFVGIRANFHSPIKDVRHEIIIHPKMSFGTGHHATTFLMIQLMQDIDFNGKEVIDFGTGTGVLAILAEKCGAENLTAIDYDEWSMLNAKENFELNGCHKIEMIQSDKISTVAQADIILANINLNVLTSSVEDIVNGLSAGGQLLISGFYDADVPKISHVFKTLGLSEITSASRENWCAVLFKK